jgi:hypothetical protein
MADDDDQAFRDAMRDVRPPPPRCPAAAPAARRRSFVRASAAVFATRWPPS